MQSRFGLILERYVNIHPKKTFLMRARQDLHINRYAYLMVLPVVAYYLIFHYFPMYGAVIAFKRFSPHLGIIDSPWVGFTNFSLFFSSMYFWRVFKNTLIISLSTLFFGFPAPIILALLLNELRSSLYKRIAQTITYIPHFISMVVISGMIVDFVSSEGIITEIFVFFGGDQQNLLQDASLFVPIYVISEIWQQVGWGTIIYLAALSHIDPELYEAATIDGAGRFRKIWSITLPGISSTIVILLILRLGGIMSVGFEKIFLLYNPMIYETSDVISTFVYRRGLLEMNWSFSTAVGLFNSILNLCFIMGANFISRRINDTKLW